MLELYKPGDSEEVCMLSEPSPVGRKKKKKKNSLFFLAFPKLTKLFF